MKCEFVGPNSQQKKKKRKEKKTENEQKVIWECFASTVASTPKTIKQQKESQDGLAVQQVVVFAHSMCPCINELNLVFSTQNFRGIGS